MSGYIDSYVDDSFVLQGRTASLRDRPSTAHLNSSRRLSETSRTTEDYRRHLERVLRDGGDDIEEGESEEVLNSSRKHRKHKGSSGKHSKMKQPSKEKSTSRLQNGQFKYAETNGHFTQNGTSPEQGMMTHKDSVDLTSPPNGVATDSDSGVSVSGVPKTQSESAWFTKPLHLDTTKKECHSADYSFALSPSSRPAAQLGVQLAAKHIANTDRVPARNIQSYPVSSMDELVKEYFPYTLGASYSLRAADPPSHLDFTSKAAATTSPTISPPAQGLVRPSTTPWKPKRSKSPRRTRPGSAHSTTSSASKGSAKSSKSLDRLFLFTTEAPATGGSGAALGMSPYQHELARLRMDRLRIEETHILEVKRQEELERIRGPQPKWYEMKTPRFHYEAHKNNELIANKANWQSLMDYRQELLKASKDFSKT